MSARNDASVSDLLARARAADPQALDRLFDKCRNYIGVIARSRVESWLRPKVDGSDLVQQTLLEAYRDFGRFAGTTEGEWLAWLRQILEHNAADAVRQHLGTDRRNIRREIPLAFSSGSSSGLAPSNLAASGESPSQQMMREERELHLADALASLAPDHRDVIMLRNLQRLSFEEVADQMGRSRPAVQMLWTRAMRKLQEAMAVK